MANARVFKVSFTGDPSTGKTSVIAKLLNSSEEVTETPPTVGHSLESYRVDDGTIEIQLPDCPGELRYQSIIPIIYRDAHIVAVVFSLDSKASFESVPGWMARAAQHAGAGAKILLIGNKLDHVESHPRSGRSRPAKSRGSSSP
jgi:small GTP-binding protein